MVLGKLPVPGVLLILRIIVRQEPIALSVGAVEVVWTFLARLFSKKTSRYCHSPVVVVGGVAQKL